MKRLFLLSVAISAVLASSALAGPVSLQISLTSPVLVALPGQTVQWTATLSDPTDLAAGDSIVIDASSFDVPCQGCAAPPASLGTYTDLIGPVFAVLAPAGNCCGDPQTLPGDAIGTFHVSPTVAAGTVIGGFLEIDYTIFSVDPNDPSFDPTVDTVVPEVQAFASASVGVLPEPATGLLLLGGLSLIAWRRRRPAEFRGK